MSVPEKALWFVFGAAVAGPAAMYWTSHSDPAPGTIVSTTASQQAIERQLERIQRRLDAIEVGSNLHSIPVTAAAASDMPAAAATELSAGQRQAKEAGEGIVRQAIAAGIWTRNTNAEFNSAAGEMRGEDRFELVRQLAVAINEGRLKIEPGAEPR